MFAISCLLDSWWVIHEAQWWHLFSYFQSLKPPLDNSCAMLRMLVALDSKPTRLSKQSICSLSNVLSAYLIDVAHVSIPTLKQLSWFLSSLLRPSSLFFVFVSMSVFLLECCWQHYFFCLFWEKKSWVAIRIFDVWLINKYLKSCKTMRWNWFLLYGTAVCILSLDPGNLNLCEVNDIWSSFLYTFCDGNWDAFWNFIVFFMA